MLSLYIGKNTYGIFIRGPRKSDNETVRQRILEQADLLSEHLGCDIGDSENHFFIQWISGDYTDPTQYPVIIDWFTSKLAIYEDALNDVFL